MFNLGPWEIAAILIVALLIFGPRKLPEIGKAIGSAINEFRHGFSGIAAKPQDQEPKKLDAGEEKEPQKEPPAG
ncbi:MAG: twin-arginine translocase TatA/TatE family subunit [bacterium]